MSHLIGRRTFIKHLGVLTTASVLAISPLASAIAAGTGTGAGSNSVQQPNIIYILADDMGYGDLSVYGQTKFETPNIDRLAHEGMKFTQHYAGAPTCGPSRCTLLTGYHTGHCEIRDNASVFPDDLEYAPEGNTPLSPDLPTLAEIMKKAGYTNGMYGKWGVGYAPGQSMPTKRGFHDYFGYIDHGNAHTYYPSHMYRNHKKVYLRDGEYSHDLIMKYAKRFITKSANQDKPFFAYLAVTIPHAAMHAPKELHDKWREKFPQFDHIIDDRYAFPEVQNPIAAFPAMMEHLDNGVGEVMQLLKDLKIDDNTIVMFSSDNGPHFRGGHDPKFWNSNGDLKGLKFSLNEGGIRVPLIARWPGKIAAGSTSEHISAFWDIMPTFSELAGVKAPEGDGISFVPTLLGQPALQKQHEYLYWEASSSKGQQALRKGKWKAIRTNLQKDPNAKIKLYNLEEDISESKNIASKHPEVVAEMKELFKTARVESEIYPLFESTKKPKKQF